MGAGKTTRRARAGAAARTGSAVDIDELIEQRERQTVADIFAKHGEPYFRAVERAGADRPAADRGISSSPPAAARSSIRRTAPRSTRDGVSVWLDVPLDRLIARVPADGRRPLAADRAEFERLYHQRRAAYEQAHLRLDAGRAPSVDEQLVEQLVRLAGDTDALSRPHRHSRQPRGARRVPGRRRARAATTATLVLGDLVGYGADPERRRRARPGARSRRRSSAATTTRWRAASSRPRASTRSRESAAHGRSTC